MSGKLKNFPSNTTFSLDLLKDISCKLNQISKSYTELIVKINYQWAWKPVMESCILKILCESRSYHFSVTANLFLKTLKKLHRALHNVLFRCQTYHLLLNPGTNELSNTLYSQNDVCKVTLKLEENKMLFCSWPGCWYPANICPNQMETCMTAVKGNTGLLPTGRTLLTQV